MGARDDLTDQGKLLFGAGFVFGVTVTLCLLGVVLVAVTPGPAGEGGVGTSLLVALGGGVLFSTTLGVGLTYLAFDHNRARIPVEADQFGLDEE
jgi:hypothetical protein